MSLTSHKQVDQAAEVFEHLVRVSGGQGLLEVERTQTGRARTRVLTERPEGSSGVVSTNEWHKPGVGGTKLSQVQEPSSFGVLTSHFIKHVIGVKQARAVESFARLGVGALPAKLVAPSVAERLFYRS